MNISERIGALETKFNELKGSLAADVISDIETALSSARNVLKDAEASEGDEKETTLGSLNESLSEMEEFFNTL